MEATREWLKSHIDYTLDKYPDSEFYVFFTDKKGWPRFIVRMCWKIAAWAETKRWPK